LDFLKGLTRKIKTDFELKQKFAEKKICLVMDNVRLHHCKEIKTYLIENDISVLYTVPYLRDFNPIETIFSLIKKIFSTKL